MRFTERPGPARLAPALAAAVLLAGVLAGCGSENDGDTVASDTGAPAADASGLPDWAPEILTDDAGDVTGLDFTDAAAPSDELLVAEVTTGDGPPVEAGQTITADYYGQLPDADEAFDSSYPREPFDAPIGQGALIEGWDEGLVGVPVGSRVIMSVPPDLGYGDAGSPPVIPGGATLYFVIDIIDAQ